MNVKLVVFVVSLIILGEFYFFWMLKKNALDLKYTLIWIIGGIFMLIITVFQEPLEYFTHLLGISLPINLVFFLGFIYVLGILLSQTFVISNNAQRMRNLTQRIALIEKDQRESETNNENQNEQMKRSCR